MANDDQELDLSGLDWRCPFCGVTVGFRLLKYAWPPHSANRSVYLLCQCPRKDCRSIVFVNYDTLNGQIDEVFPYPSTSETSWPNSIPPRVRDDIAEAARCHYAGAYRGVVVMCRRALQNVAKDKETEKKELKDQIKDLRDRGFITQSLFDASHEIRHFGGFGAHPQDDGLDQTTKLDADAVFEFVQQIVQHVYILPAKTKELARKRQEIRQG
jgi:Domain of unknown function (DUF4145)